MSIGGVFNDGINHEFSDRIIDFIGRETADIAVIDTSSWDGGIGS